MQKANANLGPTMLIETLPSAGGEDSSVRLIYYDAKLNADDAITHYASYRVVITDSKGAQFVGHHISLRIS